MFEAYAADEVARKLPRLEITSIAFIGSSQSLLAGSKEGHLCVYTAFRNRRGYELNGIYKGFERKAVVDMAVCEQSEILLCLSDGQMTAHRLHEKPYPVVSVLLKVRPVHAFVRFIPKGTDALYIVMSSKKRLHMFKWSEDDFHEVKIECNLSFNESPSNLRYCDGSIAFSSRDEYFLMYLSSVTGPDPDTELWQGDVRRMFGITDTPIVVDITDKQIIGFSRGQHLTFSTYDGIKSAQCPDMRFSEAPLQIVYDAPYVVGMLPKGKLEMRSLVPAMLVQTLTLNRAQFLANGNSGSVYVASTTDVWVLDGHANIRKNVSYLVAEKFFDLAIQIAQSSSVFTEENKTEIKRQAALNLFHQKKFEESFTLHQEIKTDVVSIIQLFPEFLPDKLKATAPAFDFPANDMKRALLALGNYLSAVRSDYSRKLGTGQSGLPKDQLQTLQVGLQVVDTTLLKCYLKTKPVLVDSLLRLHNNTCFFEDAQNILLKEHRLTSLFILYETRRKHELALELLYQQACDPDADPFFHGVDKTVDYLQTLGNTHLELIFKYAKWVLAKDFNAGLSIFIGDDSELARSEVARSLDRQQIVEFLRKENLAAVIPYLEQIIYKWGETGAQFHESLVESYVVKVKNLMNDYVHAFHDDENVVRAGEEEGELGDYRRRLLKFLQYSLEYSPQAILLQLSNYSFYEERAIILGRLKLHEQALAIYTSILNDFDAAEKYCQLYYDKNDDVNSQVYLFLLRAYICPSDPQIAGLREKELPTPQSDVLSAIRVLSRHADRIDTVVALGLLPPNTKLRTLSQALNAVLQTVHDDATACTIRRSVCEAALERNENRLRQAENTRIVVTNASECCKCNKKIGNSAFVRFPADGFLAHLYCHE